MKKQTAVEWFEYNLKDNLGKIVIKQNWQLLEDLIEQAKEMEKEQIINAVIWFDDTERTPSQIDIIVQQYYNETFKSE
jgi:peptidyl-tRNA hydrolase